MISIDALSPVPPFEQLRAGIADRIRDGRLPVGTRLPPVRRLAEDLALAPNTVARAYRELETAGLVATAGRRGTVVAASGDSVARQAAAAAAAYAEVVHRLGLDVDGALALARAALLARSPGGDHVEGAAEAEGAAGADRADSADSADTADTADTADRAEERLSAARRR